MIVVSIAYTTETKGATRSENFPAENGPIICSSEAGKFLGRVHLHRNSRLLIAAITIINCVQWSARSMRPLTLALGLVIEMSNKQNYFLTSDGSIISQSDKIVFCSVARFRKNICEGDCCFICGAHRSETIFNDEHVIPEWALREFDLFSKKITLPNGNTYRYDRYKIPCCQECNSMLGEKVEQPVSSLLKGGIEDVSKHLQEKGPWLFFIWLSLIFLKTHLRDWSFRWHLDERQGDFPISEAYDCEELHHIHCIARV